MRLLFEIDTKDYTLGGTVFVRPSVRGIIIKDKKIAMVHSLKYDYYKFAGGGLKSGESHIEALIREVAEETGLIVIPESVREYGYVHRIQKGDSEDVFIQDNYYYLCDAEGNIFSQNLDDYEAEEKFTLERITPETAISANRKSSSEDTNMLKREIRVLECLIAEKYL